MLWFDGLLVLHVGSGAIALVSGPVPMLSRKGSRLHRRAGNVYAAAMLVVAVSALVLAMLTGKMLLLGLAVFTFFLVFSGVRAIRFRRGRRPSRLDDAVCAATVAFGAGLLWYGIRSGGSTSIFFGVAAAALAGRQWFRLRDAATDWLSVHLISMGGAYIATVTAFLAVNLGFLPQPLVFISPTVLGVAAITWAAARYRRGGAGQLAS
jgi:uncharacterized membrane protein